MIETINKFHWDIKAAFNNEKDDSILISAGYELGKYYS